MPNFIKGVNVYDMRKREVITWLTLYARTHAPPECRPVIVTAQQKAAIRLRSESRSLPLDQRPKSKICSDFISGNHSHDLASRRG